MQFLSARQIRALDASLPSSATSYMDQAVFALAELVENIAAQLQKGEYGRRPEIYTVFGGGMNGEDARRAGIRLREHGFSVHFCALTDTLAQENAALSALPPRVWTAFAPHEIPRHAILLDGVLGIGLSGDSLRPDALAAIAWINSLRARAHIVAVDLPSGLHADSVTEPVLDETRVVHADWTLTMGAPKLAMRTPQALSCCGTLRVAPLSYPPLPPESAAETACAGKFPAQLYTACELQQKLPPRPWNAHKGSFGSVHLFTGSKEYSGAAALCAHGALRGGAGLVFAHIPECIAARVAAQTPPELIFVCDAHHEALSVETIDAIPAASLRDAVVAAGCGLSRASSVRPALQRLVARDEVRAFVLDADALNELFSFSVHTRVPVLPAPERCVLTPHPGEAARMLGCSIAEISGNRVAAAEKLAAKTGATVLLKGAGSLVAAPHQPTTLIPVGNPALAKGGSGDVLCGLLAALLARGLAPFDAACAAAFLHGNAADLAVLRTSADSLLPGELQF